MSNIGQNKSQCSKRLDWESMTKAESDQLDQVESNQLDQIGNQERMGILLTNS